MIMIICIEREGNEEYDWDFTVYKDEEIISYGAFIHDLRFEKMDEWKKLYPGITVKWVAVDSDKDWPILTTLDGDDIAE